jgi:hypothetical protein
MASMDDDAVTTPETRSKSNWLGMHCHQTASEQIIVGPL